jgi:hypothetical protein
MRKRLIMPTQESIRSRGEGWLDVERAAVVEFTSEDKDGPVESAFVSREGCGWLAATTGKQTIRLVFDQPETIKCISLVFEENKSARTQEFVLRWSQNGGDSMQEIVRQQWNFSPPESIREVEKYQVNLSGVTVLELVIDPDISGGPARASLKNLRLS